MGTGQDLGIIELLGLAGSISLLAGWRLYLAVLATGFAMRLGIVPLPENLHALDVLANPWIMGVAAIGAMAEFFADKIAWLDSAWDTIHTLIRPIGGALLAMSLVDPGDPATKVIVFLLGGGGALLAHGGKAGARAVVNASPEPFSNMIVSTAEDFATAGLLWFVYAYPALAFLVALIVLGVAVGLLLLARNVLRRVFRPASSARQATSSSPAPPVP